MSGGPEAMKMFHVSFGVLLLLVPSLPVLFNTVPRNDSLLKCPDAVAKALSYKE